jgi:RNA-directed DNA polymerase
MRIRKRDGTWRKLHNPDTQMRTVQYRLLTKVLNKLVLPEYVYAFEKNRNIPTMAALHVNKYCIISIDIKDFFHSIKQEKLFGILCRLGIGDLPARTISELCTYKAFVPQGALTSPKVSNLITSVTFGPEIEQYCDDNGFTLTIYADDVTISTNNRELNPKLVVQELTRFIQSHGFRVNRKKTKVMFHGSRQYVCGAVVNSKVNLIVKERKKLRAIIHNITKNGIEAEAAKTNMEPSKFLNFLRGRVNWFRQLNPVMGQKYFDKLKAYLQVLKEQALEDAEVALLYKAYMEEIDNTIMEEPITLPWE